MTLNWHPQGQNQSINRPVASVSAALPALPAVPAEAQAVPAMLPAIPAAAPAVPAANPAMTAAPQVVSAPKPAAKPAVISEQPALTPPQSGAPQKSNEGNGSSDSKGKGGSGGSSSSQGKGSNTKGWFSQVVEKVVSAASNALGHKSHRRALASTPVMQLSTMIPESTLAELTKKSVCGARFAGPLKMIEAADTDELSRINDVFKSQFMFDLNGTLLAATNTFTALNLSERPNVLRLSNEMFAQSNASALSPNSKNADTQYCLGTDAACFESPSANAKATEDSPLLKATLINQNYLRSLIDESVRAGLPLSLIHI